MQRQRHRALRSTRHLSGGAWTVAALVLVVVARPSTQSPQGGAPVFDVVSVKPNTTDVPPSFARPSPDRFVATNMPLRAVIQSVYRIRPFQLEQAPGWTASERYDIEARASGKPSPDEFRRMLEALLADRFKLVARREKRDLPVYHLMVVKPGTLGPSLTPAAQARCPEQPPAAPPASDAIPCGNFRPQPGKIAGRTVTMPLLAAILGQFADRNIDDRTGLTGTFDLTLEFVAQPAAPLPGAATIEGIALFTAIREQLGLTLTPGTGPVDVLVVERVERPTPN